MRGAADLMGDVVVHDDAAPSVGRPFLDVRLRFGDDSDRQSGQVRVSGEGQKHLAVGKGDVGDDDQINTCRRKLVCYHQGFVRAKDSFGND